MIAQPRVDIVFVSIDMNLGRTLDRASNDHPRAHLRLERARNTLEDVFVSPCPRIDEEAHMLRVELNKFNKPIRCNSLLLIAEFWELPVHQFAAHLFRDFIDAGQGGRVKVDGF